MKYPRLNPGLRGEWPATKPPESRNCQVKTSFLDCLPLKMKSSRSFETSGTIAILRHSVTSRKTWFNKTAEPHKLPQTPQDN